MSFKKLADILSQTDNSKEIYLNDQQYRSRRRSKGYYSRSDDIFDFIYLIQAWKEIVGPMLASHTNPLKINQQSLVIVVKHPIFAQELKFMSGLIIEKVIERFPKLHGQIKQIKFISSENFFKPMEEMEQNQVASTKLHPFSPEYQAKKFQANKLFDSIEDEDLKQLFTSLYLQK